ncbi:MAG: RDD family protein [Gammaproteobacteria bacterium]|nr:RDD family protein [Gammaproteobacteria bacterium]MBU1415752.1 RDD family protein [Gammaproteobacteria bacterium]
MAYESLLLLGVFVVAIVPLVLLSAATGAMVSHRVMRVYVFLCLALYFVWHWRGGRQTLAMRTWKLRIVTPEGEPSPLWRLALRYTLAWPSLALFGIGIAWALLDRDGQFLHDRLAGTRIIFAPPAKS